MNENRINKLKTVLSWIIPFLAIAVFISETRVEGYLTIKILTNLLLIVLLIMTAVYENKKNASEDQAVYEKSRNILRICIVIGAVLIIAILICCIRLGF